MSINHNNDLINFTQKLIQTPSPSGNEHDIAYLVYNKMKDLGYDDVIIDDMNNVTGVIHGSRDGNNLLFNGHIDHADTGNMSEPFSGKIMDGKVFGTEGDVIYGRGACDMKSAIAAMIYAGANLIKNRDKLSGNVFVNAVSLEEQARGEGIKYYLDNTEYQFDAAVSGEATNMDVHLGHRGKFEYIVKVHGKSCHSSNPSRGINAIYAMNSFINEIKYNYNEFLEEHDFLGKASVTLIDIKSEPGRKTPVVPDYCEVVMDRRFLPEENNKKIEKELEIIFDRITSQDSNFKAEYEQIKEFPVLFCPPDQPIAISVKKSVKTILDHEPSLKAWIFGVDGAFISQYGVPCVGFGPGNEMYAHTNEDHVRVKDVIIAQKVYEQIAYDFCNIK